MNIDEFYKGVAEAKAHADGIKGECHEIQTRAIKFMKKQNNIKVFRLCDTIVKEFECLNAATENKILYRLGFHNRMWQPKEFPKLELQKVLQQDLFQTHQNRYFDHFMDKEKKARPASAAYKLFPQDLPADGMNYSEVQQEIENRSYKPQHDNPWSPAKLQIEYDENNKPIDRQFEIKQL
jgi:hypothetical protein